MAEESIWDVSAEEVIDRIVLEKEQRDSDRQHEDSERLKRLERGLNRAERKRREEEEHTSHEAEERKRREEEEERMSRIVGGSMIRLYNAAQDVYLGAGNSDRYATASNDAADATPHLLRIRFNHASNAVVHTGSEIQLFNQWQGRQLYATNPNGHTKYWDLIKEAGKQQSWVVTKVITPDTKFSDHIVRNGDTINLKNVFMEQRYLTAVSADVSPNRVDGKKHGDIDWQIFTDN